MNGTPHHHWRHPPTDTAQNPATSSTERHLRVPIDNAHQIRPLATHRPPPISTIDSGHKVLHSDDPSPDPATQTHHRGFPRIVRATKRSILTRES
ncbi:hypothetical protein FH972_026680 [Carpinus fangiana]|uniref:Uncharacterized protein n=1 Tax=Carpinus fangiana TaxID=176857 RepID=A0A5N6L4P9_9ROSI|nr:hypothetical protein FH972_026680 [Carpinus fangiana]